jgi:hypothetical protein
MPPVLLIALDLLRLHRLLLLIPDPLYLTPRHLPPPPIVELGCARIDMPHFYLSARKKGNQAGMADDDP